MIADITAARDAALADIRAAAGGRDLVGIYAAGDVTTVPYKQIVVALGEGAKAGIAAFTTIAAQELHRYGVTVNAVAPGPTDTALFRHGKSDDQITAMAQAAALQRLGLPEDIADVVVFLATPAARWISGQCLSVNGGFA